MKPKLHGMKYTTSTKQDKQEKVHRKVERCEVRTINQTKGKTERPRASVRKEGRGRRAHFYSADSVTSEI